MLSKFKMSHPLLSGILDKNDIIDIEPVFYTEDTLVADKVRVWGDDGKLVEICSEVIAKKGTIKTNRFVSKDGKVYDLDILNKVFGSSFCLKDFFNKI